MRKDPTEFRERFQRWKNGEQVYESGLPKYETGKDDYISRATNYIAQHEGFVPNVYDDVHANQDYAKKHGRWNNKHKKWAIPTAGYGWTSKKDLHAWTKEQANERLKQDVIRYDKLLRDSLKTYDTLTADQRIALIDLYHQGGTNVFSKMPNFYNALNLGNIEKAYKHLDFGSTQTPNRNADRKQLFMGSGIRQIDFNTPWQNWHRLDVDPYVEAFRSSIRKPEFNTFRIRRRFDENVPESISAKNTGPSEIELIFGALNLQQIFGELRKNNSILHINENSSMHNLQNVFLSNLFNLMHGPVNKNNVGSKQLTNPVALLSAAGNPLDYSIPRYKYGKCL